MNLQETVDTLKSLGKEQTRKTYLRHGAREDCFGVSTADLKNVQKKVRKDPALAGPLWATGNHEARILATLIADPQMNGALISIGGSKPTLRDKATAAARRIGKVEVDHGDTGCKTPDAVEYIRKMVERQKG